MAPHRPVRVPRTLLLTLLALAPACGGGGTSPTPPPPPPPPGPAAVASVTIDPGTIPALVPQFTAQLTATTRDANGATLTGRTVTWQSTAGTVASVSNTGLVTGLVAGTTLITATSEGRTANASVTVRDGAAIGPAGGVVTANGGKAKLTIPAGALTSTLPISVTPIAAPTAPGGLLPNTAYELGPTGTTFSQPVTLEFKFESVGYDSMMPLYTIGRLTSNEWVPLPGSRGGRPDFTVRAQTSSFSSYAVMNVFNVANLTISPSFPTVFFQETLQLTAPPVNPLYVPAGSQVTRGWSGTTPGAPVSPSGLLTGGVPGGPYLVFVSDTWHVTCPNDPLGCFMGYFDYETPQQRAVYVSALTYIATGLAEAVVGLRPIAAVTVAPTTMSLAPGLQGPVSATLKDGNGATLSAQYRTIVWSTSNALVASISQAGVVTALAPGTSMVTATAGGQSGSMTLTVTGAPATPVVTVETIPDLPTIEVGNTGFLIPIARDVQNQVVTGLPVVWNSFNSGVATVSQSGVVTGVAPGQTAIGATIGGVLGGTTVTIVAPYPLVNGSPRAGGRHSCLLRTGGSIWCWGSGEWGQLGTGAVSTTQPIPAPVSGGTVFTALSAGLQHTCALNSIGQAYCWGDNAKGQLGTGTTSQSLTPAPVTGGHLFTRIFAGSDRSCGITNTGTAYCWGNGADGRLGQGAPQSSAVPVSVNSAPPLTTLALSDYNSCGLATTGEAWCWGSGTLGTAGLGGSLSESSLVPRPVVGGHQFTQLVAGGVHICGLTASGEVWCWGALRYTIVDEGIGFNTSTPFRIASPVSFTAIAAGGYNTCGLALDQTAWCWGARWGLGTGQRPDPVYVTTPVAVLGDRKFTEISTGVAHSCARATDGTWCWGTWDAFQLGGNSHGYGTYKVKFP